MGQEIKKMQVDEGIEEVYNGGNRPENPDMSDLEANMTQNPPQSKRAPTWCTGKSGQPHRLGLSLTLRTTGGSGHAKKSKISSRI